MFNHEKERGAPFCPMMRERCASGSTKSMGEDPATGAPLKCAAWRGLPMTNKEQTEIREVHACAIFEWPPQLGFEHSTLLHQARASSDKVATEVSRIRETPVEIYLPHPQEKNPLELANGI